MTLPGILSRACKVSALLATMLLVLGGPGTSVSAQGIEEWNRECRKLLNRWETAPKHKAFAASNPNSGAFFQVCGLAWGAPSKKAAEASALKACQAPPQRARCWVTRSE
jgi:hypothetical protein